MKCLVIQIWKKYKNDKTANIFSEFAFRDFISILVLALIVILNKENDVVCKKKLFCIEVLAIASTKCNNIITHNDIIISIRTMCNR